MKNVTATFATSEAAQAAVDALKDAGILDADIGVEDMESGGTVVSVAVDEGKLGAVAAILKTGASTYDENSAAPVQPGVEGHPDGSGPVVTPAAPDR